MKRALIIINGSLTSTTRIRSFYDKDTLLICADGGAEYAKAHQLIPNIVVGDMDSISQDTKEYILSRCHPEFISGSQYDTQDILKMLKPFGLAQGERVQHDKKTVCFITYPRNKDYTDSELAIEKAIEMKCTELVVFGLLGDRLDHMSANIMHLAVVAGKVSLRIIEGNQNIFFVSSSIALEGGKGDEVSLIPLQADCHGVSTKGLQYALKNALLPFGATRGVSNVMDSSSAQISVKKGMLMVVHQRSSGK